MYRELAQQEARQFVSERYGGKFLPDEPPTYKTKARGAQEAHEAIRPTSVLRQPESIKEFLNRDQYRLYQLIWQRFVASQMAAAIYDTLSVEVTGASTAHNYLLRASGSTLRFQGFLIVYEEARDEDLARMKKKTPRIPAGLEEGQDQRCCGCCPSSISPSRRRVIPRPPWCAPWKKTASAGLPPMPRSWAPCSSAITSSAKTSA